MNIEQLFKKDINREIQGVIKIGQKEEEMIHTELEEYVVTEELKKHFETFFKAYDRSLSQETDKIGTWVSGFFGSGKSHFLKILSYLLNPHLEVKGKKAVSYFEDKMKDEKLLQMMQKASAISGDVILFNIDSKSEADSKQNKRAIVEVFNKVFNEMRGYSANIPWLAQLEEVLDKNGQYEAFKKAFEEETDLSWTEGRDEIFFNMDEAVTALTIATGMSEASARSWIENGENNYSISVDSFAQRLKTFIDQQEDNYHLIFAVDEVGQFISDNTALMLNLQTVVEDLGKLLKGKVWVIVTSQQDIDSLTENMSVRDFSKIQGRFNTRISLSSANADEVIKIRLLDKTPAARDTLVLTYDEQEAALKNKLEFEQSSTMRFYRDRDDFAAVYPFVPYQFNLLQKVFTSIREHGSAGKHLSDGERNLLESIQQATIGIKEANIGKLVPFQTFYNSIDQALEHSVRSTIIKANQNEKIKDFDVEVLKCLFLIRYVDEMPGTVKNLTTLMLSEINEDMIELGKSVNDSLLRLQKEFLIQKTGDKYLFLTNEEQDVNREISRVQIPTSQLVLEAGKLLFDEVIRLKRYTYQPFADRKAVQYLFDFSQWIDERAVRNGHLDFGVRLLSVYSEQTEETEVVALSQRESKVIVQLPEAADFSELRYYLKINDYLRDQSAKTKTPIVEEIHLRKANERVQLQKTIDIKLQNAIEQARIYVNGYLIETAGSPAKRIEEGLHSLVESIYAKIRYVAVSYTKDDVEKLIADKEMHLLEGRFDDENHLATEEIYHYLNQQYERQLTITLREVMQRYAAAPYGWNDLDILGSLIRLLKEERIQFTLNSRRLATTETDFLKMILKKDSQEKIVLSIREVLSSKMVQSAKRMMSEMFGISHIGEREEEMFDFIADRFSKEQKQLDLLLAEYRYAPFPEKEVVEEAAKTIDKLVSIDDSNAFFKELTKNEGLLIELHEALRDIREFFKSNQKEIYLKAKEKWTLYDQDKNYLNNPEIDHIMANVSDILKMSRPYSRIKELPELIDRFNNELIQQLESTSQPIRDTIEQDRKDIAREMEELKGFASIQRIESNFYFKMNDLEQKVNHADTVGKLQSYKGESGEIKVVTLRAIEEARRRIYEEQERQRKEQERKGNKEKESADHLDGFHVGEGTDRDGLTSSVTKEIEPKPVPAVKSEKALIMKQNEILPHHLIEIRSEDDVDRYLDILKDNLMRSLQNENIDLIKLS